MTAEPPAAPEATIRDAVPRDAVAIAEIYNGSIAAGDATLAEEPWTADDVRRLLAELGPREALLVLESAGEVLGWAGLRRYNPRAGYRHTGETTVYLRRDLRRQGHGTALLRALLDRSRRLGDHHLVAKVLARNAGSVEFHRRHGYEVVGVQREVGIRDGVWEDVVILQRLLDDEGPDRSSC